MGRPWDWSLLGGTDPAPGDLDDVFRAQRAWAQNVSLLDEAAQLLRGPDISGEGATVDAARELLSRDIALVELYRGDCVSCAEGLAGWVNSLGDFQGEADRLHAQAMQAQDELDTARNSGSV